MSHAHELKQTYFKQQRTQKFIHILFIICVCLLIAAVLTIAIAYIEANEYVKILVATDTKNEYTDEHIANIISDRVYLTNLIAYIGLGVGIVGAFAFKFLSEKKKKEWLASETLLKDSTENKENLYD